MNSENDLFNRLKPALRCKKHELENKKIGFISEMDIWKYNKENNWRNAKGLTISQMVDDILNTDDNLYYEYYSKNKGSE